MCFLSLFLMTRVTSPVLHMLGRDGPSTGGAEHLEGRYCSTWFLGFKITAFTLSHSFIGNKKPCTIDWGRRKKWYCKKCMMSANDAFNKWCWINKCPEKQGCNFGPVIKANWRNWVKCKVHVQGCQSVFEVSWAWSKRTHPESLLYHWLTNSLLEER